MKPPTPLIAIGVLYLASEVGPLVSKPAAMGLVRIAIYSVVFFFAFRGSRGAAKLWGVMSILGGVVSAFRAIQHFQSEPDASLLLTLYAAFFFMSSAYVFFSPELRKFQDHSAVSARRDGL